MLCAARTGLGGVAQMIILLACMFSRVHAFDCNIEPIRLGITNTPLDNGVPVNRGVQFKLPGNQILGLRISTVWNNTFISNANNCRGGNSSYNNACQGAVGSTFNPVANDGWEPFLPSDWEEVVAHVDSPPRGASVLRGVAEADLDDGPTVELPVAIWSSPSIDPVNELVAPPSRSVFGIGPSSDLVRSLLNESFVPSGYMGLYFGSRSLTCARDGEFTIGGWDESRVAGPFVNYTMNSIPMNATCPLRVRVSGITLNNDQGAHQLIQDGESIPACVDPFQNAVGFTNELYAAWANLTQHPTVPDGPPFTDQTYPLANEALMDTLTISLEGGYTTTIPHCELVSLERGADVQGVGDYTITNRSRIAVSVGAGTNDLGSNYGILLGGAFLASTYLRIDYETNSFSLAPAEAGERSGLEASLQKVCSRDTSIPPTANGTIPTVPSPAASSTSAGGGGDGGLSTDAKATIGGSVAGGVIAIAGVIIAYMAYKHAKQSEHARRQSEAEKMDLERARTASMYTGVSPHTVPVESFSPRALGIELNETRSSPVPAPATPVYLPSPALDQS